jgi:hypothetical protein
MKTIYKYEIPLSGGKVNMPIGAEIIKAGFQGESLCLWAYCESENEDYERGFLIYGTGWDMSIVNEHSRKFIDTVFQGALVWHVYERF